MRLRPKKPVTENAARLLVRQARAFFQAGDAAAAEGVTAGEVHEFRILAKRFRYALEFFQPCYRGGAQVYLELLKELQATLGGLNDYTSSRELLGDLLGSDHTPPRHRKLFALLEQREQRLLAEFRREWAEKFTEGEKRLRWMRYLERPMLR
jgi:CHAD domain-containing protein